MNGLLIGRFQPFHHGHIEALRFALSQVDNLWIGIGSSNKPTEKNNPFTADERKEMILSSIDNSISSRIQIYYIPDFENHKKWMENIDSIVPDFGVIFTNDELTQSLYSKRGKKFLQYHSENEKLFQVLILEKKSSAIKIGMILYLKEQKLCCKKSVLKID